MTGPRPTGVVVHVLPVGGEGLLLEVPDLDSVLALESALREALATGSGPWRQVTDIVPAARTVLLLTGDGTDLAALRAAVLGIGGSVRVEHGSVGRPVLGTARTSHEVEIPVRYDGRDLDEVAALTGLSRAEVVAAHTGTPWRVAFGGFAPGFAYLVGGDARLRVPRRDRPRPFVPAGAVGLAGEFTGIYPRASPGGWQLVGTTDATLWDVSREPPALLGPGTTVRFVAVEAPR
ncbi:MAG TPA: carboxyltransferase domain-containing protein [Ornithinibacter sp.]|nr:carboxyltransferase domain-containing protein [Ornithinibacter sp.]